MIDKIWFWIIFIIIISIIIVIIFGTSYTAKLRREKILDGDTEFINETGFYTTKNSQEYSDNLSTTSTSINSESIIKIQKDIEKNGENIVNKKTSLGEEKCREAFEKFFRKRFSSVKLDKLKNPETGRNLELDGYNEELNIAFEYQGNQHTTKNNTYNKDTVSFIKQVRRDNFKVEKCKELGIDLIIIHQAPIINIERIVNEKLISKGYTRSRN